MVSTPKLKIRKAKRSWRTRQRRTMLRPHEYHKVKLRTASGGSLTIRYRRKPSFGSNSESEISLITTNEESITCEASTATLASEQSLYTYDALDENRTFEDLEDLSEYSQTSCATAAYVANVYDLDIQHCFLSTCRSWSSTDYIECHSSDVGSLDHHLSDLPAVPLVESSFNLELKRSKSWTALEEAQRHNRQHLEQSEDLSQLLKHFNAADETEVISSLLSMNCPYEHQLEAESWSVSRAESSLTDLDKITFPEGQYSSMYCMESLGSAHMNNLSYPHALEEIMETSDVELINLPTLLDPENEGTLWFQDTTLPRYELSYENKPANGIDVTTLKEDVKPFDGNPFLLLDEEIPNEVLQQSPRNALLVQALSDAKKVAVQDPMEDVTAMKEATDKLLMGPGKLASRSPEGLLERAACMVGEGKSMLRLLELSMQATRGKNIRKKRLRRAAPPQTFSSLISSSNNMVDEDPASDQQENMTSADSETVNIFLPSPDLSISAARQARRRRYKSLLPERAVSLLRKWFDDHVAFPFADKEEKIELASETGLTLTQVGNWLSNYRHRLKIKRSDYHAFGNAPSPDHNL